jgi:hypothetical protein
MISLPLALLSRADVAQADDPGPGPDEYYSAENRKVGGSIPSLPTTNATGETP